MKKAFTLIELLVVVLIIGILTAVALPQYKGAVLKSRYAQMISMGENIAQAQELFFLQHGTYTSNLTNLDISIPASDHFRFRMDMNAKAFNLISDKQKFGYIRYLNHSSVPRQRECRLYEDNADLHKMCRSLTKASTGSQFPGESGLSDYTFRYIFAK